jgi:hypothetical protein
MKLFRRNYFASRKTSEERILDIKRRMSVFSETSVPNTYCFDKHLASYIQNGRRNASGSLCKVFVILTCFNPYLNVTTKVIKSSNTRLHVYPISGFRHSACGQTDRRNGANSDIYKPICCELTKYVRSVYIYIYIIPHDFMA